MRKRINLLVFLLMTLILAGCSKGEKKESNQFRVGMECGYAPFNWFQSGDTNGAVRNSSNGYCGGYDVEIAKLIAKGLDKELVIVQTDWDGLLGPALQSGKIDAVIAGMSPTAERRESLDFTSPYYKSDLVVVVSKNGKYANAKTLDDFSGAKVTGQLNTLHYTVIDQLKGVNKQTAMENFPAMIVALNSGKIDAYVSERPGAMAAEKANPNLMYITFEKGKGFEYSNDEVDIAVGIKKGNTDLKDKVDKVLSEISEEQRQKIMEDAIKNQPLEN